MKKIKILAIMGEAGSGKDTLMKRLVNIDKEHYHEIISCTSRPPREGEQHGVNYYFYTAEEFAQKVANGDMLESTYFNNWFYGTGYDSLDENKINIGVFNPEGIRKLQANPNLDVYVFWVKANEKTRLLRQLNREENPDVYEIIRRFKTDTIDFGNINFRYVEIPNEEGTINLVEAVYKMKLHLDKIL